MPETTLPIEPPSPEMPNLREVLAETGRVTRSLQIVAATGYGNDLETLNRYKVFAPNDAALAGIDVEQLIETNEQEQLLALLAGDVTEGRKELGFLTNPVVMLSGNGFAFDGTVPSIGGAPIVSPSLPAINGIVHELSSLYAS